jgi:hypothetical protein
MRKLNCKLFDEPRSKCWFIANNWMPQRLKTLPNRVIALFPPAVNTGERYFTP